MFNLVRLSALLALAGLPLSSAELSPLPNFLQPLTRLRITRGVNPSNPWTVAGERGAFFGRQSGRFEAWLWPNKIFSNFALHAELADYPVPIDVNAMAAQIDVTPAETVITYSHAAFTVRQHLFAARGAATTGLAAAAVFEVDSARPLDLTFRFTPEMLRMWPAPNSGRPSGEWMPGGFYLLHTDDPSYTGVLAMPRTKPGTMVPYQEHPQTYPLELRLHFDPSKDRGLVFPLVYGISDNQHPEMQVQSWLSQVPELYGSTRTYYEQFAKSHLQVDTPNARFNEAMAWAEVAVDQMQVRHGDEVGMVAGYYESADSARPGYAWFFGRDTLWTTYAINAYGDSALTRRALEFLFRRQRQDGKIMHEYSQSAESLDWSKTPYFYAAADSAPLLVMAMWDYIRVTGDEVFLREHWPAVKRAWEYERAHTSKDGFFNNSEGTGWVESWPQGMPHQEIYLAALDCEASIALSKLAQVAGDSETQKVADQTGQDLSRKIAAEYRDASSNFYAFSRNPDGTLDGTASIYPSVAWWDGTLQLPDSGSMMDRWASSEFSTDWGTRDISSHTPFYDPISYHQGSIWPLFTGWTSLAEYRANRPHSAYTHLMSNVNLTWDQDLGSVTELLSGDFYQPLGRSSSHQMWSSAMIISPAVHGLFGIDWNIVNRTLQLHPNLPAAWEKASLRHIPWGDVSLDVDYRREGGKLRMRVQSASAIKLCLQTGSAACTPTLSAVHEASISLHPIELALSTPEPDQGARTTQLKVISERYMSNSVEFELSGPAGSEWAIPIRTNFEAARSAPSVKGATLAGNVLKFTVPSGSGYQSTTVRFEWH